MADIVEVLINPLDFPEVDGPEQTQDIPSLESIVKFLCRPEESDPSSLVFRYQEIKKESIFLFVVVVEKEILSKLLWPLKNAKGCYMIGNYLGTISLCGMVAEMVAMLNFEMSNISLNGKTLEKNDEEGLFGNTFEKLGQERRVKVLHTYGLISDDLKNHFDVVRTIRRRYLHFFSQGHDELADDARKAFKATNSIVFDIVGSKIKDGHLSVNPALLLYLDKKGLLKKDENKNDDL